MVPPLARLNKLDDASLYQACHVNKQFNSVCQQREDLRLRVKSYTDYINYIESNPLKPKNIDIGFLDLYLLKHGLIFDSDNDSDSDSDSYNDQIVIRTIKRFYIYMNEYNEDTIKKVKITGPVELTIDEVLKIIANNLPDIDEFEHYYGNHHFLESLTRHGGNYYLKFVN